MKNILRVLGLVVMVLSVTVFIAKNSFAATPRVAAGYGHSIALKSPGSPWEPTGSMATARSFHRATAGLPSGEVLITGGMDSSGSPSFLAELYDPSTGIFSPTGSMETARIFHTATLLPGGRILIAGGSGESGYLSTAELYDPFTGTFSPTGSMETARIFHTATLLPDGRVLIAGGSGESGYLSTAELYDPSTGTFSPTGSMETGRTYHTATLLPDGKVLIVGGYNGGSLSSAEVYDPSSGTFSSTESMGTARFLHTATSLPDERVLIAGGSGPSGSLSSAEVYDPSTGTFSSTGTMATARNIHTASLLPSGRVLVAGGQDDIGFLSSAEFYEPSTGTFSPTGSMAAARGWHTATFLQDYGKVLVAGGFNDDGSLNSAELYQEPSELIIWNISTYPVNPAPGQSVNVSVIIKNMSATVAFGFYVDLYKDLTSAPDPYQVGDAYCFIEVVEAFSETECTVTVSYSSTGTYKMWAQVDTDQMVEELTEENNVFGPQDISVMSGNADLIILALSAPTYACSGATLSVSDITTNQGTTLAGASITKFYLSANSTLDAGDTAIGSRSVPSLSVGESSSGTTSVGVPRIATGKYYIIANADDSKAVGESNESNNKKTKAIYIGPDLIVSSLTAPASAGKGTTISIIDTTKNNGCGLAGASTTKFYLSMNTTYDASDIPLGNRPVPSLTTGAISLGTTSVTIPSDIGTGAWYIIAVADDSKVVVESNEINNKKYKAITINP